MPLFANAAALRIIDAVAIVLNQSFQLARARLASAASPVPSMLAVNASLPIIDIWVQRHAV